MKSRLGVNVDHIATLRNARGEGHPDPISHARQIIDFGANSITIHLREDRRHIRDQDLATFSKIKKIPINLEMAANNEILKIALKYKPNFVCIVPEKRNEITTEGGINIKKNKKIISKVISKLNSKKIRTSLFINPNTNDVFLSKGLNTKCVELHTGKFALKVKNNKNYFAEFNKIKKCAALAKKLGMEVHAGHGLDYKSTKILKKIKSIEEFNIGHFIIGESIMFGMKTVISNFKKILK
tara:strand:+ start:523 stop:1242 length:720 start_codon:yes stop_codon:yes gene_type:complete